MIAGPVHDYAKEKTDEQFIEKIKAKKLDSDLLNWGNFIWHGVVGAEFIKDELKITDEEILNAVRRHAGGSSLEMTTLDQDCFTLAITLNRIAVFQTLRLQDLWLMQI